LISTPLFGEPSAREVRAKDHRRLGSGEEKPLGDHLITTEPSADLISGWAAARADSAPSRSIGQIPISWAPDKEDAIARAHEQFRWFAGGWAVNSDLPTPAGFEGATQFVRPEDVAEQIACGPDLDELAESVRPYLDAGFTDVAIVQIGDELQQRFLDEIAEPLLEKLRAL
jgi:G6PDH family F420-dependent oxidoreductase